MMLNSMLKTILLAVCFLPIATVATAQKVVHALTGTLTSINADTKTLQVFTDKPSQGTFNDRTDPSASPQIDKSIRALATPASARAFVIVFYVEEPDSRSAVALRDLGKGPFSMCTGLIGKIENKETISVTDETGAIKLFKLTATTVAETGMGVVLGAKYQPHKGDKVRIIATNENGSDAAVFVSVISAN